MKLYAEFFLTCILMQATLLANGNPELIELRSVTEFDLQSAIPTFDIYEIPDSGDDDTLFSSKANDPYDLTELVMLVAKACSPAAWMDSSAK